MRLYIGGCYQGKREYVLSNCTGDSETCQGLSVVLVADGKTALLQEIMQADVLDHFHLWVRRLLDSGKTETEVLDVTREIVETCPDIWIICDEVGMGIVPVDVFERQYREVVGRCCCELAKEAQQVVRIVCGIGMRIK